MRIAPAVAGIAASSPFSGRDETLAESASLSFERSWIILVARSDPVTFTFVKPFLARDFVPPDANRLVFIDSNLGEWCNLLVMQAYEKQLDADPLAALREGSMHFDERSAVFAAARRIVERLRDLGVPFALVGGMALFLHQYRRFTEDLDILVTPEGLKRIHEALDGLGYIAPFSGSKQLRDVETGVRVEFLVSGQFPGDGKPKPVAFPDPSGRTVEIGEIPVLCLPDLIELKLASGMTNAARLRDLSDVVELIRVLKLPRNFSEQLNLYVRAKFLELWTAAQSAGIDSDAQ